jgi:hypothetical protein
VAIACGNRAGGRSAGRQPTPPPLRQQLEALADNPRALLDNSRTCWRPRYGSNPTACPWRRAHRAPPAGMAGPLGAAQAMLGQGHGELLGAGDLISQFRVEPVSFLGVVSNKRLSATRSKGPVGSARLRAAADALAMPRSPSAKEASTPAPWSSAGRWPLEDPLGVGRAGSLGPAAGALRRARTEQTTCLVCLRGDVQPREPRLVSFASRSAEPANLGSSICAACRRTQASQAESVIHDRSPPASA